MKAPGWSLRVGARTAGGAVDPIRREESRHLRDLVTYALVEADISTRDSEIVRLALDKVKLNQRFLELFDEDKRASNANRNRARNEAE